MRARLSGLLVALSILLAACAGAPQTERLLAGPIPAGEPLPRQVELNEVPFFPQEDYYCGPAALATVLAWGGVDTDQHEVADQIYTPGRRGTLRSDVIGGARRNGRLAVPVETLEAMMAELAAGHPVIVFQNLGLDVYPVWHFAVAVGYDLDAATIVLRSGTEARRVTKLATFERTWARGDHWALTVLPPEILPATAGEAAVLEAAAGIERAGRLDAAETAYRRIAQRWPEQPGAWIGLGNVAYARRDLAGAEAMFRRATEAAPKHGTGWNNLAVVLAELGRRSEAVRAAETAVATGVGDLDEFRRTLEEVRVRGPAG